jgi:hypothetical protein
MKGVPIKTSLPLGWGPFHSNYILLNLLIAFDIVSESIYLHWELILHYKSSQCSPNGWDYIHTTKLWFKPLHTPYLTPTLNLNTRTLLEQTPTVNTPSINLLRWMYVIWLLILISHLYMSGIWLSVVPKMDTKRHMLNNNWTVFSKYNKHSNLVVNNIWKEHIWYFNKHENWYWFRCSLYRLQKLWEKGLQPQFCFF